MRTTRLWLLAYLFFVVYGSLVPFAYQPVPLDLAWQRFFQAPFLKLGVESRADWIANGVLYFPLGFLAAHVARQTLVRSWLAATLLAWLCCAAVALAVEFTQVYFPPRSVSRNDVIAELVGSGVGVGLSPWLAQWLERIRRGWAHGGRALELRVLEAYSMLYLTFCFFPYDVLLSTTELHAKVESALWGWLFAPSGRGAAVILLQLAAESLLAMPLGILLARLRPHMRLLPAALIGLYVGVAIEAGQFLVASGVSQGASALSRAGGVMVGVALASRTTAGGAEWLRTMLRRFRWPLVILYIAALAAVNGWFRGRWHGWAGATEAWDKVRLLPFYYHYYTSEAIALYSLASVSLMYMPLATLGWAHRLRTPLTLGLVLLLVTVVEASKLFIGGMRPDPTNLLIAAGTTALTLHFVGRLSPAMSVATRPEALSNPLANVPWIGIVTAIAATSWALFFPARGLVLAAVLAASTALVWWRPILALAIVPAALPILDFAPWTGRFYLDEFDLLILVCLTVGFERTAGTREHSRRAAALLFAMVSVSLAASTARALSPLPPLDLTSFSSYYSAYNAVRIVKGAIWAAFFVMFWRRAGVDSKTERIFRAGMLVGLTWTVLWIGWEREVFVGLFDFTAGFRVSGPLSAMHKGGAYVECYLAVASAFAIATVSRSRSWIGSAIGLALLMGASYAIMVTYSRTGYAALAAVLAVSALGAVTVPRAGQTWRRMRQWTLGTTALVVVVVATLPILVGPFARERLAQSSRDFGLRQAHWGDALSIRRADLWTSLFGEGLGRFPEAHFWRSPEPLRAASYRLVREGDNIFLRLGSGARLYIEQMLTLAPEGRTTVDLQLRSTAESGELTVTLCQKWLLTSLRCATGSMQPRGQMSNGWKKAQVQLNTMALTAEPLLLRAPLSFALFTPEGGKTIDVENIRLFDDRGRELLDNGDFAKGLDRWFFTTDTGPPWSIDSLPVTILFDQGWFGVVAWTLLIAAAIARGSALALRGQAAVTAALPALVGFLVSGVLNTLIDSPRFLWLLLVLLWLVMQERPKNNAQYERRAESSRRP